ncbi:MAG TPA: ABC transporter permease [Kosmotogaceae bacterium]|jgi:ribose/xylose/arabinose/galactoside ABC-type transport system permease subunit|nr:ABC transporter permease [Kosmotogaceae bacterium]
MSQHKFRANLRIIVPFLSLIAVMVFFTVLDPGRFSNLRNFRLILQQSAITMTVGFGVTFVIVSGSIDLSVGSVLALAGMIGGTVASSSPLLGVLAALGIGALCGLINGSAFSLLKVPSFIVTLGMLQAARGLTTIYSGGFPVMMSDNTVWMGSWPGIFLIAMAVFAIAMFLYYFTRFGEYVRAIGGDETVSKMSGVPIRLYKILPFLLSGGLAGLGGFMMASRLGVASPTIGVGYELDVIASVVLGGTPLTGGIGNIYGTIIGAVIMASIGNGLVIMGVPSPWQLVIKGIILVMAVFISLERSKIGNIK